jgi:hypothetical protein
MTKRQRGDAGRLPSTTLLANAVRPSFGCFDNRERHQPYRPWCPQPSTLVTDLRDSLEYADAGSQRDIDMALLHMTLIRIEQALAGSMQASTAVVRSATTMAKRRLRALPFAARRGNLSLFYNAAWSSVRRDAWRTPAVRHVTFDKAV